MKHYILARYTKVHSSLSSSFPQSILSQQKKKERQPATNSTDKDSGVYLEKEVQKNPNVVICALKANLLLMYMVSQTRLLLRPQWSSSPTPSQKRSGILLKLLLGTNQIPDFQVPRFHAWRSEFLSKGIYWWPHILSPISFPAWPKTYTLKHHLPSHLFREIDEIPTQLCCIA